MISFLKGTLAAKMSDAAVIEVNGVGYHVGMSQSSLSKLPETGEAVQVHTYLQVREDALALFGFLSLEEKELFLRLISVSGVGPKVALAALSSFSPEALVSAITLQDTTLVSRIPGVGKKTASRIILELKDALGDSFLVSESEAAAPKSGAFEQATEALLSMGFTSAEIDLALQGCSSVAEEGALLQYALKRLGER